MPYNRARTWQGSLPARNRPREFWGLSGASRSFSEELTPSFGTLLVEDGFILTEDSFLLVEDGEGLPYITPPVGAGVGDLQIGFTFEVG